MLRRFFEGTIISLIIAIIIIGWFAFTIQVGIEMKAIDTFNTNVAAWTDVEKGW